MLDKALDFVRIVLFGVLALIGFLLYEAWQKDFPPPSVSAPSAMVATETANRYAPSLPASNTGSAPASAAIAAVAPPAEGKLISVKTDLLDIQIDTLGGDIVTSNLLHYAESLGSKTPFLLLNNDPKTRYIAESGLLSKVGPDTSKAQALYTASQAAYQLQPGQNELTVKLNWEMNGISVTKTFTFVRNSYEVKVGYEVLNRSAQPWSGNLYTQLMRTNTPPANHGGFVNLTTYFGAAISSPQKPFEKVTFKQMQEKNLSQSIQDGWAAMIQHYFITAWIPPKSTVSNYYSQVTPDGLYAIGMMGPAMTVQPGSQMATETKLYVGPAIADLLEKTAPGLKLTIDYGWFWFISGIIFWMMQKIYDVIGNWGWSIVLVTVVIKLLFYQLSAKSYRSMSKLKNLQPRIEALKERLGDDKQKLTQETLALYRAEKVNPMSGCLPILIQIPVFIALYWVLVESVQLRQAPFIFWIHDLSQQDPYYVLPVLMGLSMFIQQRLNPPPPDPMQAKVMMLMPVIFTVMFANFPSGLMLYWFVNNTLSFMQQWYIMRQVNHGAKK